MTLFRTAAALLLALALGMAPRVSARGMDPQLLSRIHKIAIIVSLGDQADIMRRGVTVFDTKGGHLPLPGSDLDEAASHQVMALLASRFQIVPVTYEKTRFVRGDDTNPGHETPSLKALIIAMPPAAVDAYLVIRKVDFFLPYPDRYIMDGLGALRYRRMLPLKMPDQNGIVFVSLESALVQAGTGKILIDKFDRESSPEDEGDWADTPKAMTDAQAAKLHQHLAELVSETVAACLLKMKLSAP